MNVRRRGRLPATRPLRFAGGYHRRPFPCTAPGGGQAAALAKGNIPETGCSPAGCHHAQGLPYGEPVNTSGET